MAYIVGWRTNDICGASAGDFAGKLRWFVGNYWSPFSPNSGMVMLLYIAMAILALISGPDVPIRWGPYQPAAGAGLDQRQLAARVGLRWVGAICYPGLFTAAAFLLSWV